MKISNKIFPLFLCCYFWLSTISAQNPSNFPLYNEVVEHVLENVKWTTAECKDSSNVGIRVEISKKIDGYWVGIVKYSYEEKKWISPSKSDKWGEKKQIWSLTNGFQSIQIGSTSIDKNLYEVINRRDLKTMPQQNSEYDDFNIHPIYGFEGWFDEVVAYYEKGKKKKQLTTLEQYSLARAYFQKYHSFLDTEAYGKLMNGSTSFRKKFLAQMKNNADKAIANHYEIYENNPKFEVLVGSIYQKYCNEVVDKYMHLGYLGFYDELEGYFDGVELYSEKTLLLAKNMLNSCPKNAILFSYGDNDFFPLIYLQKAQKYRADVLVVSGSLLAVDWYINSIRDSNLYQERVYPLGLEKEIYNDGNNDYILIGDVEDYIPISEILDLLAEPIDKDADVRTIPNKLALMRKDDTIKIDLSGGYLFKSEWILLAMLEAKKEERKVCFSHTNRFGDFTQKTGTQAYLTSYGVNYVLQSTADSYGNTSLENTLTSYDVFKTLENRKINQLAVENIPFFYAYTYSLFSTINSLLIEKEKKKAIELLDVYITNYKYIETDAIPVRLLVSICFETEKETEGKYFFDRYVSILKGKKSITSYEISMYEIMIDVLEENGIQSPKEEWEELMEKVD